MAIHTSIKDLALESVTECLDAAKLLIETKKQDDGIMGYAAMLLLFSVTDAISHHLGVGKGNTRLEALTTRGFDLCLSPKEIKNLKDYFRNPLIHNATIVPRVFLTAEKNGDVFEFQNFEPVRIRVPRFYEVLKNGWNQLDRTSFNSLKDTPTRPQYVSPPAFTYLSSVSSYGVSGMVNLPLHLSSATPPSSGGIIPPQQEDDP